MRPIPTSQTHSNFSVVFFCFRFLFHYHFTPSFIVHCIQVLYQILFALLWVVEIYSQCIVTSCPIFPFLIWFLIWPARSNARVCGCSYGRNCLRVQIPPRACLSSFIVECCAGPNPHPWESCRARVRARVCVCDQVQRHSSTPSMSK